jgi:hypothetical protein
LANKETKIMIQRIVYINKAGETLSLVLDIIGKKSKCLIVRNPEDGKISNIPRKDIDTISDPEKPDVEK